jgi:hypothetical protein
MKKKEKSMRLDKNVSKIILAFRKILDKTWPEIEEFSCQDNTGAFLMDWSQSCWERIVEKILFQEGEGFLRVYGEGANVNNSPRIGNPEKKETHQILCIGKKPKVVDVLGKKELKMTEKEPFFFEQFVTMRNNFYYAEYPFDYCLLKRDDEEKVIKVAELEFYLGQSSC